MNIIEIQLQTADISLTRKFYQEILGMKIIHSDNSSITISAGLSRLIFRKAKNNNSFYHFAFTIPANQFEEAQAWARQRIQLLPVTPGNTTADFKNWSAKAFYFYDNNRNIVEFIARFDLNNNSNRPFDGTSIFSISEIGVVTDNAKEYSQKLIAQYGLNYFVRQPPQDDFVAIGDDHGLFIVVNDKRNWYPTQQPSGKYWSVIKAEFNGDLINIETTDN